jgi:seryl-tRNA synthetase
MTTETMRTVRITLPYAAHEMAQEEILKQVTFVEKAITGTRFEEDGKVLACEVPAGHAERLEKEITQLATRMLRGLKSLTRKIVYTSTRLASPTFAGDGTHPDVHMLGTGQVALAGIPLRLFRYFDRAFDALGVGYKAQPVLTPTLIPSHVLAKCDYFRSFPQYVTFACHLHEDASIIDDFRTRHQERDDLDDKALQGMDVPEACLSPAVCYHVYHLNRDTTVPAAGLAYNIVGKCFRYESSNITDLRRLWDFTMREVVFMGSREYVLAEREVGIEKVSRFIESVEMACEIRTASDPFFVAPDAVSKTYFQLSSETKYEISAVLPDNARLAVGSLNYHSDFFGRAFATNVEGAAAMHSVCIAFGVERWVHAFLAQHGADPQKWPAVVRDEVYAWDPQ